MRYCEYRGAVRRHGPIQLLPVDQLEGLQGFRSVYEFDEKTAEMIRARGSTRQLRGTPVYSDTLFLDFDNQDAAALELENWLLAHECTYTKYNTGNRSIHFHVAIEPMYGPKVPWYQKIWVEKHAPKADLSFYHVAGLFRLEGTFHHKKPGFRKEVSRVIKANKLKIPSNIPILPRGRVQSENVGEFGGLGIFTSLLTWQVVEGNRTPHMCKILGAARHAGLRPDQTLHGLLLWNKSCAAPAHDEEYIKEWFQRAWFGREDEHL